MKDYIQTLAKENNNMPRTSKNYKHEDIKSRGQKELRKNLNTHKSCAMCDYSRKNSKLQHMRKTSKHKRQRISSHYYYENAQIKEQNLHYSKLPQRTYRDKPVRLTSNLLATPTARKHGTTHFKPCESVTANSDFVWQGCNFL